MTISLNGPALLPITPNGQGQLLWLQPFGQSFGFRDSNAAGSNQVCVFAQTDSGGNTWIYAWNPGSSTWTPLLFAATGIPRGVVQGSDGKVHIVYGPQGYNNLTYCRYSLTYSGNAISGATLDATFVVTDGTGIGGNERYSIEEIESNNGTKLLAVCVTHDIAAQMTAQITVFPSTATSAAQMVGVNGAGTWTTITSGTYTNAHDHTILIKQFKTDKKVFVSVGYSCAEGSSEYLGYCFLTPNGATTWSVGSITVESSSGAERNSACVVGLYATGGSIYRLVPSNGGTPTLYFDRINASDSSITYNVFPSRSGTDHATGWGGMAVDETELKAYYAYYSYNSNVYLGYYTGSAWTNSTPAYAGSSYGAGVVAHSRGIAVALAGDANAFYGIVNDDAPLTQPQVGGTLSYTAVGGAVAGGEARNVRGHSGNVVWEATGALAYSAASGATVTPGFPAGLVAGNPFDDALVMFVHHKPATANAVGVTTPSGWTLLGSLLGAGGYATTVGADVGNTNLYVFKKDTVTGSETGTQSVALTNNSVSAAQIHRLSKPANGAWSFAVATGSDTSAGSVSITFGSDPGVAAKDVVVVYLGIPTDVTTPAQFTAEALTQTGVTYSAMTEVNEPDSGNGNDIGGVVCRWTATAGTSSAAPVFAATAAATNTNVRGPAIFFRAREASVAISTQPTAGGAVAGGAATQVRTIVSAAGGGGVAGGALASLKRTVAVIALGGAVAGGAATMSTAAGGATQTVSYTATGGAVAGGVAPVVQVAKRASSGGAIAGGAAGAIRIAVRVGSGGGVAGGTAGELRVAKFAGSSGGVAGGAATEKRAIGYIAQGGGVAGGTVTERIAGQAYIGQGGGVAGGAIIERRAVRVIVNGGGVAGGAAVERRTVVSRAAGGGIAGGAVSRGETRRVVGSGGGVAGGAAGEKRTGARAATGGAVAGGAARAIQVAVVRGTGGAVAGGDVAWSSSAPIEYYYGGEGGAVAGGSAVVRVLAHFTGAGGGVAGGTSREVRVAQRFASGGAIAGGSTSEIRIGKHSGIGGGVAGGAARSVQIAIALSSGGGVAGGSVLVATTQAGTAYYTAQGGGVAGGSALSSYRLQVVYVAPFECSATSGSFYICRVRSL